MKNSQGELIGLAILVLMYLVLKEISWGNYFCQQIDIIIAFLHELGHAVTTKLTGGSVYSMSVNFDGSGVTTTKGGFLPLITMGGYIGSCIFGNLIVRFSLLDRTKLICNLIGGSMIFCGIFWFSTLGNLWLLSFNGALFLVLGCFPNRYGKVTLQFIGVSSVIGILEDFRIGPGDDLEQFHKIVGAFPIALWMWIWLGIAIIVTMINIRWILKSTKTN